MPDFFPSARRCSLLVASVLLSFQSLVGQAHPGIVDESFNPGAGVVANAFPPQWIDTIAVDALGNVFVAGQFSSFDGVPRNRIARLHPDGSLDRDFNPGTELNGRVITVMPLGDGKVLLGGGFTKFGNISRGSIVRLNSDGSLDSEFISNLEPAGGDLWNSGVHTIAFPSDGKVVVGGAFLTGPGPTGWVGLARLNSDGTLDESFAPLRLAWWAEQFASVNSLFISSDQRIIYAGYFDPFFLQRSGGLGQLNPDGSKDQSFGLPDDTFYTAGILGPQSKGAMTNLLVAVAKTGSQETHLIRLTEDGKLDGSFRPPDEVAQKYPIPPVLQTDGKILVRWNRGIARLTSDGALDSSFEATGQPERSPYSDVRAIALQNDGKVLVAGPFSTFQGQARTSIVRLFGGNASPGPPFMLIHPDNQRAIAGQSKTFSARAFSYVEPQYQWLFNGKPIPNATNSVLTLPNIHPENGGVYALSVTNPHGTITSRDAALTIDYATTPVSLDIDYLPDERISGPVYALATLPSGKLLLGGTFGSLDGGGNQALYRLNMDGSLDPTFQTGSGFVSQGNAAAVRSIFVQPDGKTIVGGNFTAVDGVARTNLARLNTDGTLDKGFQAASGDKWIVTRGLVLQKDGKIIVEVYRWSTNFIPALARLRTDGTWDFSFNPYARPYGLISALALQDDGKILVAGSIQPPGPGNLEPSLDRLKPDGSLDLSFRPPASQRRRSIYAIALQKDHSILVGGASASFVDGQATPGLVRLNPDGSLNNQFSVELLSKTNVKLVEVHPSGNILVVTDETFQFSNGSTQVFWLSGDGNQEKQNLTNVEGTVNAIAMQLDGKMVLGGSFLNVNDAPRSGVARLLGESIAAPLRLSPIQTLGGEFVMAVQTLTGRNHYLEFKGSLIETNWTSLLAFSGDGKLKTLTDKFTTVPQRFYRVRAE